MWILVDLNKKGPFKKIAFQHKSSLIGLESFWCLHTHFQLCEHSGSSPARSKELPLSWITSGRENFGGQNADVCPRPKRHAGLHPPQGLGVAAVPGVLGAVECPLWKPTPAGPRVTPAWRLPVHRPSACPQRSKEHPCSERDRAITIGVTFLLGCLWPACAWAVSLRSRQRSPPPTWAVGRLCWRGGGSPRQTLCQGQGTKGPCIIDLGKLSLLPPNYGCNLFFFNLQRLLQLYWDSLSPLCILILWWSMYSISYLSSNYICLILQQIF